MRRSRLSLGSSILMIVLGVLTYIIVDHSLGFILAAVGLFMYWFYRRLDKRTRAGPSGVASV